MTPALAYMLIILIHFGLSSASGLIVVDSMGMIPCVNKDICHNGMNLRIVVNASTVELSAGLGIITGTVESGQEWTDSFGTWGLAKSLDIEINYENAAWEYHLMEEEEFPLQTETYCYTDNCGPNTGPCRNKKKLGMYFMESSLATRHAVQTVEKWEASTSIAIQSGNANLEWDANDERHSILDESFEVNLQGVFGTEYCYKDLPNLYYVVVDVGRTGDYYWTSKQYWQDKRNNFNISASTYQTDFDCDFKWKGWHTIIPFFDDEDKYKSMDGVDSSAVAITAWAGNQLYMWQNGFIDRYFNEIMTGCTDLTHYTNDVSISRPENDLWKVTTIGTIDHFQMTIDLDPVLVIRTSSPTTAPTPIPLKAPTTKAPTSLSPTQSPTLDPVIPPTSAPSKSPTVSLEKFWEFYEIPAKLEMKSPSVINISLPTVSVNIIKSLAFGLNVGREFIRLDFAEYMTSASQYMTLRPRRLQSNKEMLVLEFTIFATTEDEKIMLKSKLEETPTFVAIHKALEGRISNINGTGILSYIANIMDECEAGTRLMTIAGQRKCESICNVNHYYDIDSSSCKEQVAFSTIFIIKRNDTMRILFFGIGIIAGITILCLGYGAYKYCLNNKLKSRENDKSRRRETRRSKKSLKARDYDGDSDLGERDSEESDLEESEIEESDYSSSDSSSRDESTEEYE